MASLWSFFGLPDPEASQKSTKEVEGASSNEPPSLTNKPEKSQSTLTNEQPTVEQPPLTDLPKIKPPEKTCGNSKQLEWTINSRW